MIWVLILLSVAMTVAVFGEWGASFCVEVISCKIVSKIIEIIKISPLAFSWMYSLVFYDSNSL